MIPMLIRTAILYVVVIFAMRLMGKRQIGQMQISELVTITMLSELATAPISSNDVPLLYGIIPIIVLVCLEVTLSFLATKSYPAKRLLEGRPSPLIFNGIVDQKELSDSRISMNELLSRMRGQGIYSLSDVRYAFMESDGNISFVPKKAAQPASVADLGLSSADCGVDHAIIIDGRVSKNALVASGKSDAWLRQCLKKQGVNKLSEVFYFSCNDAGDTCLIRKERSQKQMLEHGEI